MEFAMLVVASIFRAFHGPNGYVRTGWAENMAVTVGYLLILQSVPFIDFHLYHCTCAFQCHFLHTHICTWKPIRMHLKRRGLNEKLLLHSALSICGLGSLGQGCLRTRRWPGTCPGITLFDGPMVYSGPYDWAATVLPLNSVYGLCPHSRSQHAEAYWSAEGIF